MYLIDYSITNTTNLSVLYQAHFPRVSKKDPSLLPQLITSMREFIMVHNTCQDHFNLQFYHHSVFHTAHFQFPWCWMMNLYFVLKWVFLKILVGDGVCGSKSIFSFLSDSDEYGNECFCVVCTIGVCIKYQHVLTNFFLDVVLNSVERWMELITFLLEVGLNSHTVNP